MTKTKIAKTQLTKISGIPQLPQEQLLAIVIPSPPDVFSVLCPQCVLLSAQYCQ